MTLTDEQAQAVVEAVLSTLWERRPFKWDLGKMKYEDATESRYMRRRRLNYM